MEIIIRYKNRKYYSTLKKRYTSLEEMVERLKEDELFKIIEHKTEIDITSKVLKQALINTKMSESVVKKLLTGDYTVRHDKALFF